MEGPALWRPAQTAIDWLIVAIGTICTCAESPVTWYQFVFSLHAAFLLFLFGVVFYALVLGAPGMNKHLPWMCDIVAVREANLR